MKEIKSFAKYLWLYHLLSLLTCFFSVNYYYYDDILAFKIGIGNNFDWCKTIEKSQASLNDNGPFSSYAHFFSEGKFCFIFNDNNRNYLDNGDFNTTDGIRASNFSRNRTTIASVEIDIQSGEVVRQSMFSQKEINSIVVPKLFSVDQFNKQLILYAVSGGRERFGILNLK